MRKKIVVLSIVVSGLTLAACGGDEKTAAPGAEAATPAVAVAANPDAEKGLELVAKSDCLTCHKVEDQSTGPAYRAIAAKYPANDATIDTLAGKIIQGGSGNWGQVPMSAHPQLSKEDARLMAKYVMSLKK